MRIVVASDDKQNAGKVQDTLYRNGLDCVRANIVPLQEAADRCIRVRPNLLVLVMSPDLRAALAVLHELKNTTQAHVLAVGPADDPKHILRTLREGAQEYLDVAELEVELSEALVRFRHAAIPIGEPGRVIAVLAPNGGSGSSTLAVNVATVLAQQHQRAALVDLKLVSGDLPALLDLKPKYTLADFCRNISRVDREMFLKLLVRHSTGVHLLAAPTSFSDVDQVTSTGVRQALRMARACFPYVIVDLDHSFHNEQIEALSIADDLLLVFRLDFASLRNTHKVLEHLGELGLEKERVVLVVNRYGQPREVPMRKAEEALGIRVAHWIPDDPKSINLANNRGVPVVVDRPRAKVSRLMTGLAMSLNGLSIRARGY